MAAWVAVAWRSRCKFKFKRMDTLEFEPGPSACEADVIPLHHAPHMDARATHASRTRAHYVLPFGAHSWIYRFHTKGETGKGLQYFCQSHESSVGRVSDPRSEGPCFDPGSRHFCFAARRHRHLEEQYRLDGTCRSKHPEDSREKKGIHTRHRLLGLVG